MTDPYHVFLSYSRNDPAAAANLRGQLERCGLSVFMDDEWIREGDLWLDRLQQAVDGCGAFVVLVGRDGVRRWIGAETQAALNRYFAPHDDAERLPIFPILLDGSEPEMLPAFLRLFQMTPWNGADELPERLLGDIRERKIVADDAVAFEGCPFVGLAAYRPDQAHLFFGRQKETLDALACFDARLGFPAVRWLEINGNSGSGKSSLMNAGLLPLVEQGWLWPRTGYERWRRIGPMMPGEHPVEMLAEHLARTFSAKIGEVVRDLQDGDDALRYWLHERKADDTAFLLAIDQFEELFTFVDAEERARFDRLLAAALDDPECPLFVISTVRADFLDRFAEDLPRLVDVQNRLGKSWKLAPIGTDGLREVIGGAARLAGPDVGQVQEAMVAEARDEAGALPLVENALHWLWEERTGNRLSGMLFTDQGGLGGILSRGADGLLAGLETHQRDRALKLLFRLVQVDPEARRHTRRRISLAEAIKVAGGGARGRALVNYLAGERARDGRTAEGPLRLITITEDAEQYKPSGVGHWVNLIHESLIRSKGVDAAGKPQPYWPTLWTYIEQNKEEAQGKLGMLFGLFGLAEARDQIEKRHNLLIDLKDEITEMETRERVMKEEILLKKKAFENLRVEEEALSPLVFLSYAREDASSVANLSMYFKKNGFRTWVDKENLLPGQKWKNAIQKTIKTADFLVLCMSSKSVTKRGFINVEQKWALEMADHIPQDQIYLIPAKIEDCPIPDSLSDYHCIELYLEDGVDRLMKAIAIEWAKRKGFIVP